MFYKLFLFLISIIFLAPHSLVFADLQINEIMYDLKTGSDTGREWIEIYNDADDSVGLSSYRFFEADTDHKIKLIQGNENIPSKGYAIIVSDFDKFKIDWPSFSGTVFDSSFSLSNDGEVLALKDKGLNVIDQYAYKSNQGGGGDGTSIQKINGVWVKSKPTPGIENVFYIKPVLSDSETKVEPVSKSIVIPEKIINKTQNTEIDDEQDLISEQSNVYSANSGHVREQYSYLPMIIFGLLIFVSAGLVYFIRSKKISSSNIKMGEDFEILDE